ncbi:MAG: hypothetical protein KF859_05895 [Phycisphaeraceae bacterium]|nr:hypothetical protein [Phycisphaeraceae bacterium]
MSSRSLIVVLAGSLIAASAAHADTININGDPIGSPNFPNGQGNYTGTLTFTALGVNSATLAVSLTNTSPGGDGYLTGFVMLNNADWSHVSVSLAGSPQISNTNFQNTGGPEGAGSFGSFRGGAALSGNFLGNGNPANGVAVGGTITATFNISGTGVGSMSASDFVTPISGNAQFVVRFRGFADGGSDQVPGIPTPGTAMLAGLGALVATQRRRAQR